MTRVALLPAATAPAEFVRGNIQLNDALFRIQSDRIALFNQTNGAANGGFGRHMAHDQAMGPAGKPSIGNQTDIATQTQADQRGRGSEHLPHSRPTFRPLVAYYDHVPLANLPG